MKIIDRVYGEITITDPLIISLINSSPMQRIKGVNQNGTSFLIEPSRNISRFEHCIGVWYLLNKFQASQEEQVAGLLHDIPHTAFSHVVDYIFPSDSHDYHDKFTRKIISDSEIPKLLKEHNLDIDRVLEKENFSLLDADLPDLSADRIDYFLRDTRIDPIFPDFLALEFLNSIHVKNSQFYFKEVSYAKTYALLFITAGRLLWLDPNDVACYHLMSKAMKRALNLGLLTESALFTTDDHLLSILKNAQDQEIDQLLSRINPNINFIYCDETTAEFSGPNKPRVVDPLIELGNELIRLSSLSPRLKEYFNHYKHTYRYLHVKPA